VVPNKLGQEVDAHLDIESRTAPRTHPVERVWPSATRVSRAKGEHVGDRCKGLERSLRSRW